MTPRHDMDLEHQENSGLAIAVSPERQAERNRLAGEVARVMENPNHPLVEYFRNYF